ncbi:uncharacterized protein LOC114521112 [Dendronephthya gigantea]|uniref:uncharacterized protein LOC114521112 n=1 Tax=Dendronephthya gigantea TaxID=151771 RepID=UPI00106DC578|nr:uncharacterized protein LOC114521112 [Dendronephthya gigantea]XP_028397330.1 uncharacterized protein LOC114521112 [Dendronephthya gigantea]
MFSIFVLGTLSILGLSKASWPDGRYCLPMPSNRVCPSGWSKGYRRHDVEDDDQKTYCDARRHGWVPYNSNYCHNLRWGFCCKTRSNYPPTRKTWPKGAYCIFRYGGRCPRGFATGYHYWDDEDDNNVNSRSGVLPDGWYGRDTKIYFCCRNDPVKQSFNRINRLYGLPKCSEMILMRYKEKCHPPQSGYLGPHTGYLQWDTEDNRNRDEHFGVFPDTTKSSGRTFGSGIVIQFCSYTSYYHC